MRVNYECNYLLIFGTLSNKTFCVKKKHTNLFLSKKQPKLKTNFYLHEIKPWKVSYVEVVGSSQ